MQPKNFAWLTDQLFSLLKKPPSNSLHSTFSHIFLITGLEENIIETLHIK